MKTVLEATGISKSYGRTIVLRDFALSVGAGETHGLLGPNGSGKSTSLHILTGLLDPDAGDVSLSGIPIANKSSRALLGFAPDDLPLPETLTGEEYLHFHEAMRYTENRERIRSLCRILGMTQALSKMVGDYSHGMKRKIQLIAAACHNPDLLVLDEPFRGLDPDASVLLRRLIHEFTAAGGAVLIATHDMLRAERDCDSVTILSSGATVASGPPELLMRTDGAISLEQVFLARTGLERSNAERSEGLAGLFGAINPHCKNAATETGGLHE